MYVCVPDPRMGAGPKYGTTVFPTPGTFWLPPPGMPVTIQWTKFVYGGGASGSYMTSTYSLPTSNLVPTTDTAGSKVARQGPICRPLTGLPSSAVYTTRNIVCVFYRRPLLNMGVRLFFCFILGQITTAFNLLKIPINIIVPVMILLGVCALSAMNELCYSTRGSDRMQKKKITGISNTC